MKLIDLLEKENTAEDPGKGWSDREFEAIFAEVSKTEHSLAEFEDLAKEVIEKNGLKRTPHAVAMAMVRMSMMIHGTIPEGVTTKSAETWFKSPGTIARFLKKKGYDVEVNMKKSRAALDKRIASEKKRRSRDKAKELMFAFYKEHQNELPKDIGENRQAIIADLMAGMEPEQAFAKYKK